MKLNKSFLLGIMAVMGLASCVSEDLQTGEMGRMKLKTVSADQPHSTRAYTPEELANYTKVTNYPVDIFNEEGTNVAHYDAVTDFPSDGLLLAVGNYTVESHTPGTIQKKMNAPYYRGTEEVPVISGPTTDVDVVCKMQNSKIQVTYSEEFLALYETWTITIDDGSSDNSNPETVLAFTKEDGVSPAPVYWLFEEGVQTLTLRFNATKPDGSPASDTKILTKDNFTRPYPDDDSQTFCGGDQFVFYFEPDDATTGKIQGVTISATVTFAETQETEFVYLTDKNLKEDPEQGDDPNPDDPNPDDPNVGSDEPTLDCTGGWNVSFAADADEEDLPQTAVIVKTPKGLKSLKVTVTGGNDGFAGATGFLNNLEIIGSEDLGEIFGEVDGAELPNQGDTEYSFPVYAFFNMIQMFGATDAGKAHEFYMVAEDMDGTIVTNTLKITVTE